MSRAAIRGTIQMLWFEGGTTSTIPAAPAAMTLAEAGAGVNIRGTAGGEDAESLSGFDATGSTVATGGLSSLTDIQIGGPTTLGDAEIVYFRDDTTEPIFELYDIDPTATAGNQGGIAIFPFPSATPPAVGDVYTYYSVQVLAKNSDYSGDAPRFRVSFSQRTDPVDGAVVVNP
jgi:hypothetical protein